MRTTVGTLLSNRLFVYFFFFIYVILEYDIEKRKLTSSAHCRLLAIPTSNGVTHIDRIIIIFIINTSIPRYNTIMILLIIIHSPRSSLYIFNKFKNLNFTFSFFFFFNVILIILFEKSYYIQIIFTF